jgi:chemosensory pili system protein ChpA (sensor histidine kinase/response regulator)
MSFRVLLADDNADDRAALRDLLRGDTAIEWIEVEDGQTALDRLCDRLNPSLCLVDLRMPRLDGRQLLERIRRDPELRALRVVVISGQGDRDTVVACSKLGVAGYLVKPYDREKTLAVVRRVLSTLEPANASDLAASRNLLARTLLAADDNPDDLTVLRDAMKSEAGWETIVVRDGQEALDRLYAGLRPDLTLLDVNMPRLDAIALLGRMRGDPALMKLRVAALSSEQDRAKIRTLAQFQLAGYLLKPLQPEKLKAALRQAEQV